MHRTGRAGEAKRNVLGVPTEFGQWLARHSSYVHCSDRSESPSPEEVEAGLVGVHRSFHIATGRKAAGFAVDHKEIVDQEVHRKATVGLGDHHMVTAGEAVHRTGIAD
jgi:hypothetical protein